MKRLVTSRSFQAAIAVAVLFVAIVGGWKFQRRATFEITAYGALSDGSTDCSEAIERAAADADTVTGGRVVFPPGGSYKIGSAVNLDGVTDVVFECEGANVFTSDRIELGVFVLEDCARIRFHGGYFQGPDNLDDLKEIVDELGQALQLEEGLDDDEPRRWPSAVITPKGGSPKPIDFVQKHNSHLFRLIESDKVSFESTRVRGYEQTFCGILDTNTRFDDVDIVGILEDSPLDTFHGTEGRTGVQDKQLNLWTYQLNLFGSYNLHFHGRVSDTAGAIVAGLSTNNRTVSGIDKRQPTHLFIESGTEVCNYHDNGFYFDGCFDVTISGIQVHDTKQAGCFIKMHGSGYSLTGSQFKNGYVGIQFAGQGKTPALDDKFGHAGLGLVMSDCRVDNTSVSGLMIQSDGANYPRQVKIHHNHFISCGMATPNTLGASPFDDDNWGSDQTLPIRLMANNGPVEFSYNTIDESAGGYIIDTADAGTYDSQYAGKLAFKATGQFHGLTDRALIRVEGHSIAAYNTEREDEAHYIEKVIDDTSNLQRIFVTSTAYSSAGSGGIWEVHHPPYGLTTEEPNDGVAQDAWTDQTMYGLRLIGNEFIRCRRGVRLTNVAASEFIGNWGIEIGGCRDVYAVPALFCCDRVLTSRFDNNVMRPPGGRVVWVSPDGAANTIGAFPGGGIYSGNTESNNKGSINTTAKNSAFLPSDVSGVIAWWSARATKHVLLTDTSGAPSSAGAGAWGDTPVSADGQRVATWVDLISSYRLHQVEYDRRPVWYSSAVNSQPALSFDGTNDFLRGIGDLSDGTAGEIIIVFKDELEPTASNDFRALFSTQNEAGTPVNMGLHSFNTSTGKARLRFRHRDGTNDLNSNSATEWTPGAAGPWKIACWGSTGSAYSGNVSDGAGNLTSVTVSGATNDGKWFRDTSPAGITTFRQSITIGATATEYQAATPTWAGDAGTFFKGSIAEIIILDGDQSANRASIFTYLKTIYGNL